MSTDRSSLVWSALACQAGSRGFESRRCRQFPSLRPLGDDVIFACPAELSGLHGGEVWENPVTGERSVIGDVWSATLPQSDKGRVARNPARIDGKWEITYKPTSHY
jgi:hypothetical protein